jgi:DNA-binding response OmpR family regulator
MRVLIASNDHMHLKVTKFVLAEAQTEGIWVSSASELHAMLNEAHYDLLLLDTCIDEMDGFELCREVRTRYNLPIIFLASHNDVADRIRGLKFGADDYMSKPYEGTELLARIEAVMRRYGEDFSPCYTPISAGSLQLDPVVRQVNVAGRQCATLTAREFELLYYLVQNARRILSSRQLYQRIWGIEYDTDSNLVPVYIGRLRRKIEEDHTNPRHILYIRDLGYCFRP